MLKEDVKIEKWSSLRGLDRNEATMTFRFSNSERNAIETAAAARLVRSSDIVRGSLIYAGVIPEPAQDDAEDSSEPTQQIKEVSHER